MDHQFSTSFLQACSEIGILLELDLLCAVGNQLRLCAVQLEHKVPLYFLRFGSFANYFYKISLLPICLDEEISAVIKQNLKPPWISED
jgi:hypothetical protein